MNGKEFVIELCVTGQDTEGMLQGLFCDLKKQSGFVHKMWHKMADR